MASSTWIKPVDSFTGIGTASAPNTGFGWGSTTNYSKKYAPGMQPELYKNPWYMLGDVYQGINAASPIYQNLRNLDGDPLALYNVMQGANTKFGQGTDHADYINWLGGMYKNQGTAGGQGFNARQLLGNIYAQTPKSDTTLSNLLQAGDASNQIKTLYNLVKDVTAVGMNPLAATAYQTALARNLDAYGNDNLRGTSGKNLTPLEWLRRNGGSLVVK